MAARTTKVGTTGRGWRVGVGLAMVTAMATPLLLVGCEEIPAEEQGKKPGALEEEPEQKVIVTADGGTAVVTTGEPILQKIEPPPPPVLPPADPVACTIPAISDIATVSPAFIVQDEDKGIVAPVAKGGGNTAGTFRVDKATVWLPESLKGLVKPESSTGTVVAWASFRRDQHRFNIKVDLSVDSKKGPQKQNTEVASDGTFTLDAKGVFKVATSCPGSTAPTTEVSFLDQGARVTFLLRVPTNRGDVILALEANRGTPAS